MIRDETELVRIDPVGERVVASIPVAAEGDACSVTFGAGSVWVTAVHQGTLARVDPQTNEIVDVVRTGGFATYAVIGEGAVWLNIQRRGSGITKVDLATHAVTRLALEGRPVLAAFGSLWVERTGKVGSELIRLDPQSGETVQAFAGRFVWNVRAGDEVVWFTHNGEVVALDSSTNDVVGVVSTSSHPYASTPAREGTPRAGGTYAGPMAIADGAPVVGLFFHEPLPGVVSRRPLGRRELARIDPGRMTWSSSVQLEEITAVDAGAGSLWVAQPDRQSVVGVKAPTMEVVSRIPVGGSVLHIAVG